MSPRTLFLSKLIGLYCILASLAMLTHREANLETAIALFHDPPVILVLGVITLLAGLAMVLGHNIWSGGALPVIVTLIGWATLIKSLLFLFLPLQMQAAVFLGQLHYRQLFYVYAIVPLVLGIYLTYRGFTSMSH